MEVIQTQARVKELITELKGKFVSSQYMDDPGLLKQRVRDQGKALYYWMRSFEQLFVDTNPDTRDDILFYVKYDAKNKKEVIEALRKDSKSLPNQSDQTVLWDQTFYLNLLLHEFEYHLTCCVLSRKEGSESLSERLKTQVTMQVYPTTKERRMDKKSKSSEDSYPNLMFYIDNYEQIFHEICLHCPGEKVAVQIIAVNPALSIRRLIFMGGLDFTVLKNAVQQKEKENASFTISLLSRKKSYTEFQDDFFFIQMKGPDEKGFAQMAVRLTNSTKDPSDIEDSQEERRHSEPHPPSLPSSSVQDISTSSPNTEDTRNGETAITGPTTSPDPEPSSSLTNQNHLVPPISGFNLPTSSSAESFGSTHSGDQLFPSKKSQPQKSKEKPPADEQDAASASKKGRRGSKHRLSKKDSKGQLHSTVHAYLTYVQLPWYTLAEDILKGYREPLF